MTSTLETPQEQDHLGLSVRPARPDDVHEIASLLNTAGDLAQVSPDETFPLTPEIVRHWIDKRDSSYVLEQRGRIVGYAELVPDARDADRVWIGHMMVSPAQRGLGLGSKLVRALLRIAEDDRSAREVAISAFDDNERALRCYRGCGFENAGTHRVRDRHLVEMRYRVPGWRPLVPLAGAMAVFASVGAAVATVAGASWNPVIAVAVASVVGVGAWALHPIIPRRRDCTACRFGRSFGYGLAVGALALVTQALLGFVFDVDFARALVFTVTAAGAAGIAFVVMAQIAAAQRLD